MFRTSCGTQVLRPIQAIALVEALECGGLFTNARVGAGKTLISALLPTVFGSKRPLLLIPANLMKKTEADFRELRLHWQIPLAYRIESYSKLGTVSGANLLNEFKPDLLVCDEAHKLKRVRQSAVAKRVARFIAANSQSCRRCFMTGTMMRDTLMDYIHMLVWALGNKAPVPLDPDKQQQWADVLDPMSRNAGRPEALSGDLGVQIESREQAQEVFRERLVSTPGVIISTDTWYDQVLTIRGVELETPPAMDEHFATLRLDWKAPDGWEMEDAQFEVYSVARQLALGLYHRHDPWPPKPWWNARSSWCSDLRTLIELSDRYDSAKEIQNACEAGHLDLGSYEDWAEMKPTFKVRRVTEWLSNHALDAVEKLAKESRKKTIVWVASVAFGQRLSKQTGWAYFREEGKDALGRLIDTCQDKIVIASQKACSEGHNLQQWNHNVLVTPPPSGLEFEQLISRTHRDGQTSEVTCAVLIACREDYTAMAKAQIRAGGTAQQIGQEQKLLIADVDIPRIKQRNYAFRETEGSK